MTTPQPIPDKLSEEDARKLIEQNAARHKRLTDEANQLAARAQVEQRNLDELTARAQERYGTTDLTKIEAMGEENAVRNAQAARAWIQNLDQVEAELVALKQSLATPR